MNSELNDFAIFSKLREPVSLSACFQWTGSTPLGFQEAFRALRHPYIKRDLFICEDLLCRSLNLRRYHVKVSFYIWKKTYKRDL